MILDIESMMKNIGWERIDGVEEVRIVNESGDVICGVHNSPEGLIALPFAILYCIMTDFSSHAIYLAMKEEEKLRDEIYGMEELGRVVEEKLKQFGNNNPEGEMYLYGREN